MRYWIETRGYKKELLLEEILTWSERYLKKAKVGGGYPSRRRVHRRRAHRRHVHRPRGLHEKNKRKPQTNLYKKIDISAMILVMLAVRSFRFSFYLVLHLDTLLF